MAEKETKTETTKKPVKKTVKKTAASTTKKAATGTAKKTTAAKKSATTKKTTTKKVTETKPSVEEKLIAPETASEMDELINAQPSETAEATKEDEKFQESLNQVAESGAAEDLQKAEKESTKAEEKFVFQPLPKYTGKENCEEAVEDERKSFKQDVNKATKFSRIGNGFVLIGLVAAMVCMFTLPDDIKWITYIVIGVVLVGFIVLTILSRRTQKGLNANVETYVDKVMTMVDSYVFDQEGIENPVYNCRARAKLDDIVEAHYFDTINGFNSRNTIKAQFLNRELKVSEIACRNPYQVPADGIDHSNEKTKKPQTESYGIFGKYFSYPLALKNDASLIIMLKGTNAYLPTFLDGYMEMPSDNLNDSFLCWTTDNLVAKEILDNKEFCNILNQFHSDMHLENMFLSINERGLKVCLNYNESVMEIPTEKPTNPNAPYAHYKNDVSIVLSLIKILNK